LGFLPSRENGARHAGSEMAAPPESFLLKGPIGPVHDVLVTGEVERARRWGEALAAMASAAVGR
jgi:hypothetical protein